MFIGQQVYHSIYGPGRVLAVDRQVLVRFETEHPDLFGKGNGQKLFAWCSPTALKSLDEMTKRYFEYVSRLGFAQATECECGIAGEEDIIGITKPDEGEISNEIQEFDNLIGLHGEDIDGGYGDVVQPFKPPLPRRADDGSAGYDFYSLYSFTLEPHKYSDIVKFGVKVYMPKNEFLSLHIRSSLGIKHGIILANSVGIIDSSYVNNPDNEGEICARFYNMSDKPFIVNRGDRLIQGIFQEYKVISHDEVQNKSRLGGIGSTKI